MAKDIRALLQTASATIQKQSPPIGGLCLSLFLAKAAMEEPKNQLNIELSKNI